MIKDGCIVEIIRSKCGYTGKGETLNIVFRDYWLVKVENNPHGNSVILVKSTHMRYISPPPQNKK